MKEYLNKEVEITQIKSGSKLNSKQKGSLIGLGLRGIGSKTNGVIDYCKLGMIKKIHHIIKIVKS
jgi:ribosomal protein L30/L7E